jgi:CTP:phosphocholine cytidylyltransferase-like protein/thiamine kinase-like enzyme
MYMNIQECDILSTLLEAPCENQRQVSERCGHSLGIVNRCVRSLTQAGYLDGQMQPTEKAVQLSQALSPRRAVILAAGFGLRMIPVNREIPKGLLIVQGTPLVERLIGQLQAVGIYEIYLVVGFMKEQYEYLIDKYGVKLLVNAHYATKNNLHSLQCAAAHLENAYILPCDLWFARNPFRRHELYAWYMVSDQTSEDSTVHLTRKRDLTVLPSHTQGDAMVGVTYLCGTAPAALAQRLNQLCQDPRQDNAFWEEALYTSGKTLLLPGRVFPAAEVTEINTYEQLRSLDRDSNHLKSDAMVLLTQILNVPAQDIQDITVLKKGMTNRSFLFTCHGKKYIMRIPGEGTNHLVNRQQEAAVYQAIAQKGICDHVLYINPENGYKIVEFLENARACDASCPADVQRCMAFLRSFHEKGLTVEHTFDIFQQIDYYESLRGGASVYRDYGETKALVWSLKPFLEQQAAPYTLTHIDAIADNFLFVPTPDGTEALYLIDWEYAGMQDAHVDIAMFAIYGLYDREQLDKLIAWYFPEGCSPETVWKIYGYVACCGLLWSNWCEYKRSLGTDFGAYSLAQYRYAKDYGRLVKAWLEEGGKPHV